MRFTKTRMTKSFILLEIFHTASEIYLCEENSQMPLKDRLIVSMKDGSIYQIPSVGHNLTGPTSKLVYPISFYAYY